MNNIGKDPKLQRKVPAVPGKICVFEDKGSRTAIKKPAIEEKGVQTENDNPVASMISGMVECFNSIVS